MTKATPAGYLAFTAPINPPGVEPLTVEQIWAGLHRKVRHAQEFVAAISATEVLDESQDEHGRPVVTREAVFKEGNQKVKEVCVFYEPSKVEFHQPDGTKVMNIISDGADGGLYMTYSFEWLAPGTDEAALQEKIQKWKKMAEGAVVSSIVAMREMVKDGRIAK